MLRLSVLVVCCKVLDINHNRMEQLPAAVTHCTNLLKLNADNNVLTELVPG